MPTSAHSSKSNSRSERSQQESSSDSRDREHSPDASSTDAAPRWPAVACGAAAAVGVAWAAAFVTVRGVERDVGIAAWVAAAVVGASATISAAGPPSRFQRLGLARRVKRLEDQSVEDRE